MSINTLRDQFGSYAKDLRINLEKVLKTDGAPDLNARQIFGIALATAYATKSVPVIQAVTAEAAGILSDADIHAAKAAASIMGMNNIYYRFVHLVGGDYSQLPANLRMMVIGNPGVDKVDFELYALAVSAITGCGMCMESHVKQLEKTGLSKIGIQSSIRIASVINGVAQAYFLAENTDSPAANQAA